MSFCTTVDFVATVCLTVEIGLVMPPHGVTNIFSAISKVVATAAVPSIFVFLAHIANVSATCAMVPCRF
jgi:TRAP-type C4-dicarboxylate transport system permease large subunit